MVSGKEKVDSMRIVIDARMINESGIGRYLRNLLKNLQKLDNKNEYLVLHLKQDFDTWKYQSNFHKVLADFKWYTVAEQIKLPRILDKLKPELVHFPHFNIPIFYRGKFIVTIHDLIHQHYSMQRSSTHGAMIFWAKKFGYKKIFGSAIKKSSRILVPSQFVKKQLVDEWKVSSDKVVVTSEGVNLPHPRGVLSRHDGKNPYIFYVGNAHPHKNIEGLIKTFLTIKSKDSIASLQNDKLQLILSGKENYFWQRIKMDSRFRGNDIVYTGYVSDEQLVALYKNASVYAEPSFEEGFGLPLLEAFAAGCPVVASDIGSLKEVGGDAALYFDPHDTDDMVEKIGQVLNSEKLRHQLIEKGKKRVKLFSWKKMAEETLEVYNELL